MTLRDPMARIADELSPERRRRRLALFAALGDSFTAGTGCGRGEAWPELLATAIRKENPSLELRNLAVEGATSGEVREQLSEAIELEPDLVTVVCGANDALRSTRPDPDRYAANLSAILIGLRRAIPGVRLATATSPEQWDFLGLGPRTRDRVATGIANVNGATRRIAAELGVPCLDVASHPGLADPRNFGDDGLHPSPLGHRRAAHGFAYLLGRSYGIEIPLEGA
jgi:lysophospholipase L1-like esterase